MFMTIRKGERVAVWNRGGDVTLIDGPSRLLTWGRTLNRLERHVADVNTYLIVSYLDGRREHLPGPAFLWFNPLEHREIRIGAALPIDANEAVVVYSRNEGRVDRRVVRGPWMFVPEAGEWLHEFSWHGSGKDGGRKIPHALRFRKLRVIPDQMYHDAEDVRTSDDALVTVRLMLFFELADIGVMLDQTHDPIADFINALTADVVAFAGSRRFEEFKRDAEALNDLVNYSNLVRRAGSIGYRINKVVYRGYAAGQKLQAMHDGAIEARTALKLEEETERQKQELADLRQRSEMERQLRDRENETEKEEHALRLLRRRHEEEMRRDRERAEQEAMLSRATDQARLVSMRGENLERETVWRSLAEMGVDMTRYLVAQYQNPDRVIRIDGAPAAVHLEKI